MRRLLTIFATALLSAAALAADTPERVLTLPCAQGNPSDPSCNPSKTELKKARTAFAKGLKFQKAKQPDQAFEQFGTAARLVPRNLDYVTALELARQQLVFDHIQKGNADLLQEKQIEAQAEFRSALSLDSQNEFAKQRLGESVGEWAPRVSEAPRVVAESAILRVVPKEGHQDFHFRGDARTLLTQVAGAFGVMAEFDESVVSRRVHFDIQDVDFYTALRAAGVVTGTFWSPLAENEILVARDTPENQRLFSRMAMRTFYVPGFTTPQSANEMATLIRNVFEVKFFGQQPKDGTLIIRAPVSVLDAVTDFLEHFWLSRPQILLDIEIYQIDHQLTRDMGLHIPNQFTLFNIPAAAVSGLLASLGGQNIQSLINQLISSGGINQANSQAISGLLAQLGQQNSPLSQIFNQPLATFGGGLTLMGLSLGNLSAQLSLNESWVKTVDHANMRVAQGNEGTFHLGTRYPIMNASFAPVFNTSAISQVLQNGSFQAPFPSFTYEDLGLSIKAKPVVHANADVSLQLEMQLRTLAGQSLNGVPVIANREYKGAITLVDGEPAVVAGAISRNEQLTLSGIPGLGAVPGLNKIAATNSKTDESDELLMVITPRLIDHNPQPNSEVWLSTNQ